MSFEKGDPPTVETGKRGDKSPCPVCKSAEARGLVSRPASDFSSTSVAAHGVHYDFCERCGFIYNTSDDLSGYYDSEYKKNIRDKLQRHREFREMKARQLARRWEKILPITGGRALDIGSFFGATPNLLQKLGWDVQGVEPSPTLVELCKELYGLELTRDYFRSDLFPAEHFDFVNITNVLEHVRSPFEMLSDAWLNLRPGGFLYLEVPCIETITTGQLGGLHLSILSLHTAAQQVRNAGYEIVVLDLNGFGNGERNRLSCLAKKVARHQPIQWHRQDIYSLVKWRIFIELPLKDRGLDLLRRAARRVLIKFITVCVSRRMVNPCRW